MSSKLISGIETAVSCSSRLILTSVGMVSFLLSLNVLLSDICSAILIVGISNFEPFGNDAAFCLK